jgi:hypothetical protein
VYQSVRALGFEPVLYVYHDDSSRNGQLSGFYNVYDIEESISQILQVEQVGQDSGKKIFEDHYRGKGQPSLDSGIAPHWQEWNPIA